MKILVLLFVVFVVIGMAAGNASLKFFLAEPGQGCDSLCAKYSGVCIAEGFAGINVNQKFACLGFPCKAEQPYWTTDQPCIQIRSKLCTGTTKIPEKIDCADGHNSAVRRLCPCTLVNYFMAEPGESCNNQCGKHNMVCVPEGFRGVDVKQKFESVGFPCKAVQPYWTTDQPCIQIQSRLCTGTTKIPEKIDCADGHNHSVRRLCPCGH